MLQLALAAQWCTCTYISMTMYMHMCVCMFMYMHMCMCMFIHMRMWGGGRLVVAVRADDCAFALRPVGALLSVRLHHGVDGRARTDAAAAAHSRSGGEGGLGREHRELAWGDAVASQGVELNGGLHRRRADGALAEQPVHLARGR